MQFDPIINRLLKVHHAAEANTSCTTRAISRLLMVQKAAEGNTPILIGLLVGY